jgi:selenocysteine lyase/cysteine desulfurase
MTGTQNHEGIAGTTAAIDYLANLAGPRESMTRRQALLRAFEHIGKYEMKLLAKLLDGLAGLAKITVWGLRDRSRFAERLPTVSFTHSDHTALEVARMLGRRGIFVWDGNYYALEVTRSLGLEPDGMVRVGLLHYNTEAEVDRLLTALAELP